MLTILINYVYSVVMLTLAVIQAIVTSFLSSVLQHLPPGF